MIVHREFKQNSLEWMCARAGIPTASAFDQIVDTKFALRTGQMPASYMASLVAEKWQGGPLPGFGSWDTEQGQLLQKEAICAYEFDYSQSVDQVGFITTDGGLVGCSPDGLLPDECSGLEIKCLQATHHVRCLLDGELPKDFAAQVHGSMWVTGLPQWKLFLYRRHFPPLLLTIQRDEEIIEKLSEALAQFLARFQSAMKRMEEINGGPSPASRAPTSYSEEKKLKVAKEFVLSEMPS
ncbi:MAG: YqaJ viral recombinase family protein [Chthoniobacteraceae bacterium]|nr:YqaJ viral recombinase family protein [Chthoniobacteraceae bacterium]